MIVQRIAAVGFWAIVWLATLAAVSMIAAPIGAAIIVLLALIVDAIA